MSNFQSLPVYVEPPQRAKLVVPAGVHDGLREECGWFVPASLKQLQSDSAWLNMALNVALINSNST